MRKILLIFLLITSITIIGCSSDSGSSGSYNVTEDQNNSNNQNNNSFGSQVYIKRFKSIVTNGSTVYAITTDDKLYAWGYNRSGQVGNGESGYNKTQTTPYEVKEVGTVKSVVTTGDYDITVYAITTDDRLYAWGYNVHGEVGNGESGKDENGYNKTQTTPYEVKEVGKVKSVVVTDDYDVTAYAITTDDRLYAWGYNGYGEVGNGDDLGDNVTTPYEVKNLGKVKSVVAGNGVACAITTDDKLYFLGGNWQKTHYEVKEVGTVKSVVKNGRGDTGYAITTDDKLYAWGWNDHGQVGNGESGKDENGYDKTQGTPYEVKAIGKVKSVVAGYSTVYAITEDDRLYAWGWNVYGQVGNDSTEDVPTPYEVKAVGKVKSIVAGYGTVYAITTDDKLYAWGDNDDGQIGNGESGKDENGYNKTQKTPYEVKEVGKVKSVVTTDDIYSSTIYAITTDDKLYAWGWNGSGQVGNGESGIDKNGDYFNQTTPYEVNEVGTVKSVVTNGNTVYAITEDDRLYDWGMNHQTTPYEVIIFK